MIDWLPLSDIDLGWLAGFYEGEGHARFERGVSSTEGRRYSRGGYLRIQFTQKDLEPLFHVKTLVAGCGRGHIGSVGKGRDCYCLSYTNRAAVTILNSILPLLSARRRSQATVALTAYASRRTRAQYYEQVQRNVITGQFAKRRA